MKVADFVTGDEDDEDVVGSVARTNPGTGRDTTSPILLNIDELLLLLDFILGLIYVQLLLLIVI